MNPTHLNCRNYFILTLSWKKLFLIFLLLAGYVFCGCDTQKKAVRYKGIYEEKPAVILVANTIDKCQRKDVSQEKTKKKNSLYNDEINQANTYFHQGIYLPLTHLGYYVIQDFSATEILKAKNVTNSENLKNDSLTLVSFSSLYDIDAILFTTIFAWKENPENWSVYVHYQLKSARTNNTIFQIWVKGKKEISISSNGALNVQPPVRSLASKLNVSNELAQRILLFNQINNYVLANLPVGKFAKDFDKDQNKNAYPDCLEYSLDELGTVSVIKIPLEKFEQECFLF